MIFAHLPAGYLISRFTYRRLGCDAVSRELFVFAGLVGAIAPDFDLAYFYLIDARQHHHHTYFTHFPVLWIALLVASICWLRAARVQFLPALAVIFSLNGLAHMALDSVAGDIAWLAPWNMRFFSLIEVPALYEPWWLNFILHRVFVLEAVITLIAYWLWRSSLDCNRMYEYLFPHGFQVLKPRAVHARLKR